jgi:hypothetical protein
MMIVKADKRTEAGELPSQQERTTTGKYNRTSELEDLCERAG